MSATTISSGETSEEEALLSVEFLLTLSFRGDRFDGWNSYSQALKSCQDSQVKPLHTALKDAFVFTNPSDLRIAPLVNIIRGMHCRELGVKVSVCTTHSIDTTVVEQRVGESIKPNGQVLRLELCKLAPFETKEVVETYATYVYSASGYSSALTPFAIYCSSELCDNVVDMINRSLLDRVTTMAVTGHRMLETSARLCTRNLIGWGSSGSVGNLPGFRLVEVLVSGYGPAFRDLARRLLWAITRDITKAKYDLSSLDSLSSNMPLLQVKYLTLCGTKLSEVERVQMDKASKAAVKLTVKHEKAQASSRKPENDTVLQERKDKLSLDGHFVGNFKNYYTFNPTMLRMKMLDCDIFREVLSSHPIETLLDLGCNQGDLTMALHSLIVKENATLETVGVDVDASLIQTAKKLHKGPCRFMRCDLINSNDRLEVLGDRTFDVVACFGLTMWIHLNHGDDGLVLFLETLKSLTRRILVIEPQSWKSYRAAKSRIRRAGGSLPDAFTSLNVTGEGVEELIDAKLKSGEQRYV